MFEYMFEYMFEFINVFDFATEIDKENFEILKI